MVWQVYGFKKRRNVNGNDQHDWGLIGNVKRLLDGQSNWPWWDFRARSPWFQERKVYWTLKVCLTANSLYRYLQMQSRMSKWSPIITFIRWRTWIIKHLHIYALLFYIILLYIILSFCHSILVMKFFKHTKNKEMQIRL